MGLANFLHWLDQSPARYWWTLVLCFGAMLLACVTPLFREPANPRARLWKKILDHDAWFCLSVIAVIFAGRWPTIAYPRLLNPDEGLFVSAALTLWHDPIFWRSICVGTSGPLTSYLLLLPRLFGYPFGYASARTVGLLASSATVIFFYFAARQIMRQPLARIAVVPTAAFFSLTLDPNFVHYAGELCPLLILALALFCLTRLWVGPTRSRKLIFTTGLLAGAAPFAKLQAAPLAALIGLTAFSLLACQSSTAAKRLRDCALVTLGGILPALAALGMTWATGCTSVMLNSYLLGNITYVGQGLSLEQSIAAFPQLFARAELLRTYFVSGMFLVVLLLAIAVVIPATKLPTGQRTKSFKGTESLVFAALMSAIAFYSALAPGRHYPHYLLFLVLAGAPLLIVSLRCFDHKLAGLKPPTQRSMAGAVVAGSALLSLLPLGLNFDKVDRPLGHLQQYLDSSPSAAAMAIRKYGTPGEPLGVWGWADDLFVESGMWRATRDTVLVYAWVGTDRAEDPVRTLPDYKTAVPQFFQDLFMADFRRSDPAVFVDAVSPYSFAFRERGLYGYETFPPLAAYVDGHYRLAEEVDGMRIFVKKNANE